MKLYPSTGRMVDEFRVDKGKGLPNWPAWCFIPLSGWYAMVSQDNLDSLLPGKRLPLDLIPDVGRLAAIGTWRYSQGIYRLDADFQAAISETIVTGDIPSEVLYRLPEWCVYIETPGLKWLNHHLFGFWCHLEYDINAQRTELRLLLDTESVLIPIPLHIGPWTVTEAVDRVMSEAAKQSIAAGFHFAANPDDIIALSSNINPLVSMLLYLCSDAPDVNDDRQPGSFPSRPKPVKTKKGWRLFPVEKPRIWTMGGKIGEQLRQVSPKGYSELTGRTVKAHFRKGHWHGYWTGPVTGQRKFIYKWVMPMAVGGGIMPLAGAN